MSNESQAHAGGGFAGIARELADPRRLGELARRLGPLLAGSVLPFVLVVYLALKGGGYDTVVYSQVGVAAWWIVLLGAVVGVLPVARLRPAAWLALGVLAAIAVWTALGIGWSESEERSVAELGRVAAYLGVFAFALCVQGTEGVDRMVKAVGAAVALVGALALLSRLHPAWFPSDEAARALPAAEKRLNYPLNYWNGLAALMAIGIPLALVVAAEGRTLVGRALAAAAIPMLALTTVYTVSRGGIAAAALGVTALLVLYPRRLALLPTLALAAAGAGVLVAGALKREALADGLNTAAARAQGDEMLAMTLVVCAGAALVQVALGLAARHRLGPRPNVSRATSTTLLGFAAVAAIVLAFAVRLPGEVSDRWEEFKQPGSPGAGIERLESAQGNFRYQVWSEALDANAVDPLVGIGPGSFEYWWARNKEDDIFVRDAHSLYLETLGELGIVGLALLLTLVGAILVVGARRAFRGGVAGRAMLAGATAGCLAFAVAAAVDWAWEIAVLPVAFLLLAAAILGPTRAAPPSHGADSRPGALPLAARGGVAVVAVASLVAIAVPLAGAGFVRESQQDVNAADFDAALKDAGKAQSVEPFAARPQLQEALVLESAGEIDAAAVAAREAVREEPANWRNWVVVSRLEARLGNPEEAVDAYREARSLNPRSALFER